MFKIQWGHIARLYATKKTGYFKTFYPPCQISWPSVPMISGVDRAIPGGGATYVEYKLRKKMRKNLGNLGESNRRVRKNEEIFLSCPLKADSLATPQPSHDALPVGF